MVKPLGYGSIMEDGGRKALYTHVLTSAELADRSPTASPRALTTSRPGALTFMRHFGVALGHFDFCVDGTGRHFFLECNGSGGRYQFIEKPTGLDITSAVADLLEKGVP